MNSVYLLKNILYNTLLVAQSKNILNFNFQYTTSLYIVSSNHFLKMAAVKYVYIWILNFLVINSRPDWLRSLKSYTSTPLRRVLQVQLRLVKWADSIIVVKHKKLHIMVEWLLNYRISKVYKIIFYIRFNLYYIKVEKAYCFLILYREIQELFVLRSIMPSNP